ncbi:MAG: oxaloacetate-decarboxylating malate dehydrogenase, partial [Gammaproteobacteria bacterium]
MFTYKYIKNNQEEYIETSLTGKCLLTMPQLNKGTAFPNSERRTFKLLGKLPLYVETLEEQVKRAYLQFCSYATLIQKNIYLNNLHDKNQVLFYKLVSENLVEMMPIIYTPVVGQAVTEFHRHFQQPRGLYLSYSDSKDIDAILDNRTNAEIDLIVITDGERILGLGDQGVGGIDIPIAKLMLYTLCADVNPMRTLPIQLDVGTNNQELLDDPLYLGWRHKRIMGQEYDNFLERVISAIEKRFPKVFLHWEDFGRNNARRNLERFEHRICSFNDDIQGTGAVTLAALLSAIKVNQSTLSEQRVVLFG